MIWCSILFRGAGDQELLGEGGDLRVAVHCACSPVGVDVIEGTVVAGLPVGSFVPGIAGGDVHEPPLSVQVDLIPHMDVVADQDAGDASPIAEELEGVGVGHAAAGGHAVLGQHLSGAGIFDLVGHAVADIPHHLFCLFPVAQSREAVDEFLGVLPGRFVVFDVPGIAHRLSVLILIDLVDGAPAQGNGGLLHRTVPLDFADGDWPVGPSDDLLPVEDSISDTVVGLLGQFIGEDGRVGLGSIVGVGCREWRWGAGRRRRLLLLVRHPADNNDGVVEGVIADAEIHRLADVPELHIVVPADGVGFQFHPLAVHEKLL